MTRSHLVAPSNAVGAEFALDPDRMQRFRGEALALAAINHPNIATVFGFEEPSPGLNVLVMERVEGESLADRLRSGALPPTEALRVMVQVAEALEAAHRRGVIHRTSSRATSCWVRTGS